MTKIMSQHHCIRRLLPLIMSAAALILVLVLFHGSAHAMSFSGDVFIQQYNAANGLKSAEITDIEQTDDGYIWAGGYSGLYRFDGMSFSQVLKDSEIFSVMSLCNSSDGHLWIGTNDMGLACYDPETKSIKFYNMQDGLSSDSIRCICEDNEGNMYIGTSNSLCRISKGGKVTSFDDQTRINYITSLCCLDSGIIVGTTNSGIPFYICNNEPKEISINSVSNEYFSSVGKMSDKHAYLATSGNKIYDINFEAPEPSVKFYLSTGSISGISSIKTLSDGQCYVCADNGLGCITDDGSFKELSLNGFSMMLYDVLEDYQGNLWFSSTKQGVAKVSYNSFQNPLHAAGLDEHVVNSITKIDNYIVAGCDDGVISMSAKDNSISDLPWQHEFDGVRIRNILYDSKGNIWVSTYGYDGLVLIEPSGKKTSFNDNSNNAIGSRFRFAKELKDGTILAASSTGLNFINGTKVVTTLSKKDGLDTEEILDFCETPDGKILAASDGGGIYVIKDRKIVDHIGEEDGLGTYVILKIVPCSDGYIYITSNALYYDNGTEIKRLKNFPYNNCYSVHITEDGQAWICTSAGIYILNEKDLLDDKAKYPYITLNQTKGLDATLTSNSWNYVSDNGVMYLCTSKGIRTISIPDFNNVQDREKVNAYIQSITIDGTEIQPDEAGIYNVPHNAKRITVRPAVLNYNLSLPRIHIYLEDFDDEGVSYSHMEQNEVSFTNVSPGTHKLVMEVLNEKDDAVLNQIGVTIKKQAAFHETPWFYLLLVCIISFITWSVVKTRHMDIIKKQYQEIKEANESIEKANKAKSLFLAKMSHDIRTPINAMIGMNEMILQECDSESIRSYARDINASGKTLVSLVDEILDITKIESQQLELNEEEYDTAEVIRETFAILNIKGLPKGLRLIGNFDEKLPARLIGDSLRIKEVLLNLMSNAVKYTEKGSITFSISLVDDGPEKVRIRFSIKDTGVGIPKDKQHKIFDAYERIQTDKNSHITGTGLGLNISKQILSLMDSDFELDSDVGKGSEFSFVIDQKRASFDIIGDVLRSENVASDEVEKQTMNYYNPDADILVVDDTPLNLKVTKYLLKNTGARIDTASSDSECIEMVKDTHYDLILLDDMMDGLSGTETLEWIKSHPNMCHDTPVVVLTANALIGAKEEYLSAGFDAYLSKPITMADLEEIMVKYVGGSKND